MNQVEFQENLDKKINNFAKRIIEKGDISDEINLSKLGFYIALHRVTNGKANPADIGLMDAINDTLQELKLITSSKTFLSYIPK
jgi:hypothetical protein